MSSTQQSIVKQASAHFRKGEYEQAKTCYQHAGKLYGLELFANSIRLCELRLGRPRQYPKPATTGNSTEQQLADTQKLLERYYTRCQELEYQLLDRE